MSDQNESEQTPEQIAFHNATWQQFKEEKKEDSLGKTILQIVGFVVIVGVLALIFGH